MPGGGRSKSDVDWSREPQTLRVVVLQQELTGYQQMDGASLGFSQCRRRVLRKIIDDIVMLV